MRIGDQSCSSPEPNFDGKIDDVAIWNRALSGNEISSLYNYSNDISNETYLWSTGETTETITVTPTETTEYWVDVTTDGLTCRETVTITVNPNPSSPVSGGDVTECETSPIQTLTASASVGSGETLTWYDAATGGNVVTSPTLSSVGTVTYYAEASNDTTSCVSEARTSVSLTIESAPAVPTGDAAQSFCYSATVSDLQATGENIQWYDAATGGNLLDASTSLSNVQIVYATQTVGGCESLDRLAVTVQITNPQAPTGDATQSFCDSATVSDLQATGENIQWYDAATAGNLLASTASLTDGQVVYATQTNNGCESTSRLAVTVSLQVNELTASATEICAGESVDLSVTASSGSTISWSTGENSSL